MTTPSDRAIRDQLHGAFPAIRDLRNRIPDSEYPQLARDLPLYRAEDAPHHLAVVLDYLLDHPAGASGWAHMVIYYLDPTGVGSYDGDDRSRRESSFEQISPDQASALLAWLKHAKDWDELRICQADVDAAITYWTDRVSA